MHWGDDDDALMIHWWCADAWVSLNPKLLKNIAHVESFKNFVFVFVFVFVLKLTVGVMGKDISAYNHYSLAQGT